MAAEIRVPFDHFATFPAPIHASVDQLSPSDGMRPAREIRGHFPVGSFSFSHDAIDTARGVVRRLESGCDRLLIMTDGGTIASAHGASNSQN